MDKNTVKREHSLNELTNAMCRWPIGDPQDRGFYFCGKLSVPSFPYCEKHMLLAHEPERRKRRYYNA